ncbi:uncharacterized protein LOC131320057 [Rhododendron vialii]|uniref:uncharacterized protein LOC131320057 n=1 Tax=Rhododendron vialii TaxID=182163 RepID=UPI00265EF4A1|nr:uncharacterized protein LOC131320057 [Rhododendron vialii]XP_058206592.1 uncharacterized protein LOC131320057 [Rhododendron vialii]
MEDFRSKSYAGGRMQLDSTHAPDGPRPGPTGLQDLRCYSASYASSSSYNGQHPTQTHLGPPKDLQYFKKGRPSNGSTSKSWSLGDPELQRKKRVASYKAYTVEGKVKGSIRKSFRWIKDTCNLMVHGWR